MEGCSLGLACLLVIVVWEETAVEMQEVAWSPSVAWALEEELGPLEKEPEAQLAQWWWEAQLERLQVKEAEQKLE